MTQATPPPELLTPAEVADLFAVDTKPLTRWAKAGKLAVTRTLGGHRRYHRTQIETLLQHGHTTRHHDTN